MQYAKNSEARGYRNVSRCGHSATGNTVYAYAGATARTQECRAAQTASLRRRHGGAKPRVVRCGALTVRRYRRCRRCYAVPNVVSNGVRRAYAMKIFATWLCRARHTAYAVLLVNAAQCSRARNGSHAQRYQRVAYDSMARGTRAALRGKRQNHTARLQRAYRRRRCRTRTAYRRITRRTMPLRVRRVALCVTRLEDREKAYDVEGICAWA